MNFSTDILETQFLRAFPSKKLCFSGSLLGGIQKFSRKSFHNSFENHSEILSSNLIIAIGKKSIYFTITGVPAV